MEVCCMASIRALAGRGTLFMDFRYQGKRCREYTALPDTTANRKRLEKALARIEAEIANGTFNYEATFPKNLPSPPHSAPLRRGSQTASSSRLQTGNEVGKAAIGAQPAASAPQPTPTFTEFAQQWVNEHQVEWRRSHIRVLQSTLQGHLLPRFGTRPVGSISKADVLAFRNALCQLPGRNHATLSPKRVNGILALMRQILGEAAERHGFANPMLNLKTLRLKKSDVEPFTLDEVQRMLGTVRADYRDYFVVRFFTGMRTGECHGLKWKYVDFDSRIIRIRETIVLGEDEYTKTDSSQRDIQMSQPVFEALQRQHQATAGLSAYVFCNREGKPLDNKNFTDRVWYPLLRHLGVSERRPYQMRHTAATLWLASGEAPEWIARQLGHASTEMLFRVYSRYVPNLTRRDGSAIDRLLASRFAGGQIAHAGTAQLNPGA
jgi:integrase